MTASLPVALNSLPYWRFTFRPAVYRGDRIASARECLDILESVAIRVAGWRYPFVSRDHDRTHLRKNHAEAFVDSGEFREFGRLYRSGQFLYVTVLREALLNGTLDEVREISQWHKPRGSIPPTGGINIIRMMRLVTVAFLNAQSLVERLNLGDRVGMSLRLANIKGHVLVAGPRRELDEYYQVVEESIEVDATYSPEDVRIKPLALAIAAARDIYAAFGWLDPLDFVLAGIQEEALK